MVTDACGQETFLYLISRNNFDDTCKYIDQFYQISGEAVKEPVNKFKLTTTTSSSKSPLANYARQNSAETRTKSSPEAAASLANNKYTNDQRVAARKYVNLRQAYFDKAHEAYSRGWKNVAYYYSMLVSSFGRLLFIHQKTWA